MGYRSIGAFLSLKGSSQKRSHPNLLLYKQQFSADLIGCHAFFGGGCYMLNHDKMALLAHYSSESPTLHVSQVCTKQSQLTEG